MSALMDLGLDQTKFAKVSNIDFGDRDASRFLIGIPTIDKLFGDKGVMPGTITIVSAGVGAGKTTFLLQVLESIALTANKRVGYVSGEEDVSQLAYNAHRIGVANVKVANMSDVDHICDSVLNKFDVIVIDSFQCLSSQVVKGKNKAQLYSIARLVKAVKATNCVVFIILHLTKDGKFKGDSTVGHAVDVNHFRRSWHRDEPNPANLRDTGRGEFIHPGLCSDRGPPAMIERDCPAFVIGYDIRIV